MGRGKPLGRIIESPSMLRPSACRKTVQSGTGRYVQCLSKRWSTVARPSSAPSTHCADPGDGSLMMPHSRKAFDGGQSRTGWIDLSLFGREGNTFFFSPRKSLKSQRTWAARWIYLSTLHGLHCSTALPYVLFQLLSIHRVAVKQANDISLYT